MTERSPDSIRLRNEAPSSHACLMKKAAGRPTKLCPEVQAKLISMVQEGQFRATAARALGIAPETVCRWMARPERQFRRFRQALLAAEAESEAELVEAVAKGAAEDPQSSATLPAIMRWSAFPDELTSSRVGRDAGTVANDRRRSSHIRRPDANENRRVQAGLNGTRRQ